MARLVLPLALGNPPAMCHFLPVCLSVMPSSMNCSDRNFPEAQPS